jgi:hypothetical protein
MRKIFIAMVSLALCGCLSEGDSRRVLEGAGYTQIELGGMAVFGCSKEDKLSREFKAVGQGGKPVDGVLCGGFLKGITIRLR